jgi:hypothetical protein
MTKIRERYTLDSNAKNTYNIEPSSDLLSVVGEIRIEYTCSVEKESQNDGPEETTEIRKLHIGFLRKENIDGIEKFYAINADYKDCLGTLIRKIKKLVDKVDPIDTVLDVDILAFLREQPKLEKVIAFIDRFE